MSAKASKKSVTVSFKLSNTGSMDADEVAQLYVHRVDSKVEWPEKELKAFKRVTVPAGQTVQVELEIPVEELRYWDENTNAWTLEHGKIELRLGAAADDIRLTSTVTI